MPQELQVLQCYSCHLFQVQIVKKTPKWKCNVCNEKQSLKKVYAQGSGKDCRLFVQDLNMKRGESSSAAEISSRIDFPTSLPDKVNSLSGSKWSEYIDETSEEDISIESSFSTTITGSSVKNNERGLQRSFQEALSCSPIGSHTSLVQKISFQKGSQRTDLESSHSTITNNTQLSRAAGLSKWSVYDQSNTTGNSCSQLSSKSALLHYIREQSAPVKTDDKELCNQENRSAMAVKKNKWSKFLDEDSTQYSVQPKKIAKMGSTESLHGSISKNKLTESNANLDPTLLSMSFFDSTEDGELDLLLSI